MKLPGGGMTWKQFFVGLKDEVSKDNVTDVAATVTYYSILSLFPFLLFLVAVASLVITPQQAEQLVQSVARVAPHEVTQIVGQRIHALVQGQSVGLLTFGVVFAIWSASGSVSALMRGLDTAYDVKDERPWWKRQAIALGMTIVFGLLGLVAAILMVVLGPVSQAIGGPVGTAIEWARWPVAAAVVMFLWALAYYVLPDVEQRFRFITPGSVAGVLLWLLASWGFSVYVGHFGNYDKTYGSLGGVIVLLLWTWISSLVVLVGAEMNAVIEHASPEGKRPGAKRMADAGAGARAGPAGREEQAGGEGRGDAARAPAQRPPEPRPLPARPVPEARPLAAPPPRRARPVPAPAGGHARAWVLAAAALAGVLVLRRRPA